MVSGVEALCVGAILAAMVLHMQERHESVSFMINDINTQRHLSRLLHSPILVAIGLSVGQETWPPVRWHHPFVIGLSEDRLRLPRGPLHYWHMPAVRSVQGTVKVYTISGLKIIENATINCGFLKVHLTWLELTLCNCDSHKTYKKQWHEIWIHVHCIANTCMLHVYHHA